MGALIAAAFTLIGQLAPLASQAMTARKEDHAAILKDVEAAVGLFMATLLGLRSTIESNDAMADQIIKDNATKGI